MQISVRLVEILLILGFIEGVIEIGEPELPPLSPHMVVMDTLTIAFSIKDNM